MEKIADQTGLIGRPEYRLFQTHDLDEARCRVSQVYCDHQLSARGGRLDAFHYHLPLAGVSFNYMQYGAQSCIEPGYLQDFYLIQVPVQGRARIDSDSRIIESGPARASVINPSAFTRMIWSHDCRQFSVQISRERLEKVAAACLGMPLQEALVFEPTMERDNAQHACWWRHLFAFLSEYREDCSFYRHSGILESELDNIIKSLLYSLNNNYTAQLLNGGQRVRPRHVRLAVDYIHAHLDEKIPIDKLVEAAGVSERCLYDGFQRFQNTSPMRYIQNARLEAVHDVLRSGRDVSVTETATAYGFGQLGRFASLYRQAYRELPSETLARARCLA